MNHDHTLTGRASVAVKPGGYWVLSLVATAHAMGHAYGALLPLLYPAMMADLRFGYSQLGILVGVSRVIGQAFQLAMGYLGRFVPRKILLGFGMVGQGTFLGLSGLAQGFWPLFGWQSLKELAGSPQHPNGNALILDYFGRTHRGRALSIHFAVGNAGTILVPLVGVLLLTTLGWRTTLFCFALPGIALGLLMLWGIQEGREATPATERFTLGRETLALLRNRNFRLIIGSQASGAGRGLGIVITFVPLYLSQELGLTVVNTGFLFTLMLIGSVVGPMLAGFISDRLGARKSVLIISYLASTLVTLLLVHLGGAGTWLLSVVLFILGCVVFAESPMLQSLATDSTEAFSQDIVFGVYYTLGFGAGALWAIIIGALVDHLGFRPAFYVMAASYVVAALWILPLRLTRPAA